jgi:hypothetical protein
MTVRKMLWSGFQEIIYQRALGISNISYIK